MQYDDYINIAILGGVSVGKSTLLNTLFAEQYSDTKYKRTTMVPQIYYEVKNIDDKYSANNILENNRIINEKLAINNDINYINSSVLIHYVPKISDLINLHEKIGLCIYDIPGLNDALTKSIYYNYVNDNFNKFDIIIFLLDTYSAMNTSDQMDILNLILENIKIKKDSFKIDTNLIVLVNKCDEMIVKDNNITMENDIQEMYDQAKSFIDKTIIDKIPNFQYYIRPISCELSYIYRMLQFKKVDQIELKYDNEKREKIKCI
jgi:small GTP-binding protein